MTSFAWLPLCGIFLLRTLRWRMCLIFTLQLMNSYFYKRLDAGLFNTCRIKLRNVESSSGWQLMQRQNTSTIAFRIWEKMRAGETCVNLPTYVVTKLMKPIFKHGYNITCNNFFTSLDVAQHLAVQKFSIVGTVRQNRRKLPQAANKSSTKLSCLPPLKQQPLFFFTFYQCKKSKIGRNNKHITTLKKPKTVLFYNKTKAGVNVIGQMARIYSVKTASRR